MEHALKKRGVLFLLFGADQIDSAMLPDIFICIQLEQLSCRWRQVSRDVQQNCINVFNKSLCVWDYKETNVNFMKNLITTKHIYTPYGFHECMLAMPHRYKEHRCIDCIYFGARKGDREEKLMALQSDLEGLFTNYDCTLWGDKKLDVLSQAKVSICIKADEDALLETVRINHLVSNGVVVVSEMYEHDINMQAYIGVVTFVRSISEMACVVARLCANEAQRRQMADCAMRNLQQMDYERTITKAMFDYAM